MSDTPRLKRRNHGKGHSYQLDGSKVIGVTTVCDVMSKPALIDWAANTTAEAAVDRWDELSGMPPSTRLNTLKRARWDVSKAAALRGTQIHALGERVANGEADVDAGVHIGEVEAYARFLDWYDVQVIATETPLCHTRFRYAGTADVWAVIGRLGGVRCLLDVKTGRGVYDETAMQLAGYRYADLWQPDGPESEEPLPPVDAVYVAHVLPDRVDLLPVEADEATFLKFRYALELVRWREGGPWIGAAVDERAVS